jgi:mRNA interferase RelE/StbE
MTYTIVFSEEAAEQFARLPAAIKAKIAEKIDALAETPLPHNAKKMKGYDTLYRIRFSEWRVVYEVLAQEIMIDVLRIGNRRDVYQQDF